MRRPSPDNLHATKPLVLRLEPKPTGSIPLDRRHGDPAKYEAIFVERDGFQRLVSGVSPAAGLAGGSSLAGGG